MANKEKTVKKKKALGGLGKGLSALIPGFSALNNLQKTDKESEKATIAEKQQTTVKKAQVKGNTKKTVTKQPSAKTAKAVQKSEAVAAKKTSKSLTKQNKSGAKPANNKEQQAQALSATSVLQAAQTAARQMPTAEVKNLQAVEDLQNTVQVKVAENNLETATTEKITALVENSATDKLADKQYLYVDISNVIPNKEQPRQQFSEESLQMLAASIKDVGLLQPVLVQKLSKHGKHEIYQIVAGERRWRAAQRANLTKLPVLILQDNLDPLNLLKEAIIENVQRENLNPIEEAEAYKKLAEEFNLSQEAIAEISGKSRPAVSNMQRLLKLPEQVKKYLINGELTSGQARPLLQIEDKDTLCKLAEMIVKDDLSARQVENKVKEIVALQADLDTLGGNDEENEEERAIFRQTERLQRSLSAWFGQQVQIKQKKGKGKLIVAFNDYDELDTILEKFGITDRI